MIALPIRVILLAVPFWLTKRKVRIWLIFISLVLYALLLFANAFYYVHWYVFKLAVSHMESIPLSSALNGFFSLGFAAYAVYKLMCGEDKRKYTVVFLFNICLMVISVYAVAKGGPKDCPACCPESVENEYIYKWLYRIFEGKRWFPPG